jgi:hypothetical protein
MKSRKETIMKKQMTKLTLNRETVRNLDTKELGNVLGGVIKTNGEPTLNYTCSILSEGC